MIYLIFDNTLIKYILKLFVLLTEEKKQMASLHRALSLLYAYFFIDMQ